MQSYQELLESFEDDDNPDTREESGGKAKIATNAIASELCRGKFGNTCLVVHPSERSNITKNMVPQTTINKDEQTYHLLQHRDPDDLIWENFS
jgi:hypothetical protein